MDILNILTVVVIVLVIEAAIYGICCFMCRERHVPGEIEDQSKITHHHSAHHPSRITHVVDHQKTWSPQLTPRRTDRKTTPD